MEKRNGSWSSQTRADDADDIERLAKRIRDKTTDPEIGAWAKRIASLAADLERELR